MNLNNSLINKPNKIIFIYNKLNNKLKLITIKK